MLKDQRYFISNKVNSFISLRVPKRKMFEDEYTLTMGDCSRNISWHFEPGDKGDLNKCKKLAVLFTALQAELEESMGKK